jgi:hypothetical protein
MPRWMMLGSFLRNSAMSECWRAGGKGLSPNAAPIIFSMAT